MAMAIWSTAMGTNMWGTSKMGCITVKEPTKLLTKAHIKDNLKMGYTKAKVYSSGKTTTISKASIRME